MKEVPVKVVNIDERSVDPALADRCGPTYLALLNRFSAAEIEAELREGLLFKLRSEKIPLYKYPNIKIVADKIDQELFEGVVAQMKITRHQNLELNTFAIHSAIEKGLDVSAKGTNGCTLVHEILWQCRHHGLIFGYFEKLDCNAISADGWTPLDYAVEHYQGDVRDQLIRYLVTHKGCDPFTLNHQKRKYLEISPDSRGARIPKPLAEFLWHSLSKLEQFLIDSRNALLISGHDIHRQQVLELSYIEEFDAMKSKGLARQRSAFCHLLAILNDFFSEGEISHLFDLRRSPSAHFLARLIKQDCLDLVGDYPVIVKVVYENARASLPSCLAEQYHATPVNYAVRLASDQIARNSGRNLAVRFFANREHEGMRTLVLNFVQATLWEEAGTQYFVSRLMLLLSEFSPEEILSVLTSTDPHNKTLISYFKETRSLLHETLLHDVKSPEVAAFLIQQGLDVNAEAGYGSPLHYACRENRFEVAVCLVNNGADIYAEKGGVRPTPFEMIGWERLSEKRKRQWKSFLEPRMGITHDDLQKFRTLDPQKWLTVQKFLTWPLSLRYPLIAHHAVVKELLHSSSLSFKALLNLDPRPEKPLILEFLYQLISRWDDPAAKGEVAQKVADLVTFKSQALWMACYRKRLGRVFFSSDVVATILFFARPDSVSPETASVVAHKMLRQKPSPTRGALINYVTDYLDKRKGNRLALYYLREALLAPTDENMNQIREFREYYEDVDNTLEKPVKHLYEACLKELGMGQFHQQLAKRLITS